MLRIMRLATVLAVAAPVATAQISLSELATIDLDSTANQANPEFVGSNPAAVAWDGTDLFVAGFNNSGNTDNTGIVKVTGALSGTPSIGAAFGVQSTPPLRGYSGLDISGSQIAAAYDDGTASPMGITSFDLSGALLWAKTGRGGSGVGFDPGFASGGFISGNGVGWTTFGSGRRSLQDSATGADIFTSSDGMIINGAGTGTFWRDMEFDDDTGDIWLREGNNVIRGVRTGANAVNTAELIVDATEADFVNGQNIAYVADGDGDFVVYNDRAVTSGGQALAGVVRFINADDGAALAADFGGFSTGDGNGYYDFSYDAASGTLAVLDFSNRNVHIFGVDRVNYFPYGDGCAGVNGVPVLSLSGDATPGGNATLSISQGAPNASGFLAIGAGQAQLPLGNGCDLLVNPPLLLLPVTLDGAGDLSLPTTIPAAAASATIDLQALLQDNTVTLGFTASNGLEVDF